MRDIGTLFLEGRFPYLNRLAQGKDKSKSLSQIAIIFPRDTLKLLACARVRARTRLRRCSRARACLHTRSNVMRKKIGGPNFSPPTLSLADDNLDTLGSAVGLQFLQPGQPTGLGLGGVSKTGTDTIASTVKDKEQSNAGT